MTLIKNIPIVKIILKITTDHTIPIKDTKEENNNGEILGIEIKGIDKSIFKH